MREGGGNDDARVGRASSWAPPEEDEEGGRTRRAHRSDELRRREALVLEAVLRPGGRLAEEGEEAVEQANMLAQREGKHGATVEQPGEIGTVVGQHDMEELRG